ncbi:MAG: MFS transporter [Chloroflexi bacterium]|nr:MFS transporter [Chloroflexota bacterium]
MTTAVSPLVTPVRARAARVAVSTLFIANGAISASILPRLPAIKDNLGLSNGELGTAVAAMPVGGLIAGGLVGFLIVRFGSGRVATVAGVLAASSLVAVGLATSWLTLALAMLVLGMFDATMDASMNAHGIGLQRTYGRSILQGFHGMWSVGSLAAAAVGAVAAGVGVPVSTSLAAAAGVTAIAVLLAGHWLLPAAVADAPHDTAGDEAIHLRSTPRLLRILVPIAILGILCVTIQGSAATWSAVYLTDVLGQPAGIAASAFVVYMAAMVLGRLTNDRWVDRWGSTTVVRAGALIASGGLVLAIVAAPLAAPALAFVGFAGVGLGSSPMFPVMIGAAGSRPGIPSGHGVAIVAWLVRIGLIFAPAMVGAAADIWGLAAALLIPLVAGVMIVVVAPVLTGAPRERTRIPVAPG